MKKQLFFFFGMLFLISFVSAASFSGDTSLTNFNSFNTIQYSNPSINQLYSSSDIATYWPQLAQSIQTDQCNNMQDFLIAIPPAGCTPMVVRSDLLAEQNVPVMCQLISAKVNPLIDVSNIKSLSFQGKYPADVSAVSYYPARAALRSDTVLLGSPVVNNIGYVTIVLKRQQNESSMPKNVSGNLTATITYDAQKAFGVGAAEFYLQTLDNTEWESKYVDNSFWMGRGYLRLVDVQGSTARIGIYTDQNHVLNEVTLKEGETSNKIYFPGFYCQAGLRVKLNSLTSDADSAILSIDNDRIEVRQGSQIINGRCTVTSLVMGSAGTGKVELRCNGVSKNIVLSLVSGQQANISVGSTQGSYSTGNLVANGKISGTSNKQWYLAYVGNTQKQIEGINTGTPFVVLVGENDIGKAVNPNVYTNLEVGIKSIFDSVNNIDQTNFGNRVASASGSYKFNDSLVVIYLNGQNTNLNLQFNGVVDKNAEGFVTSITAVNQVIVGSYYKKAGDALNSLLNNYPQNTESDKSWGEQALWTYKTLSNNLVPSGIATSSDVIGLLNKFLSLYPTSTSVSEVGNELGTGNRFDNSNAVQSVYVDNDYHTIALTQMKYADVSAKSTELNVNGIYYGTVHENDRVNLSVSASSDYLYVKKIYRSGSVNIVDFNLYHWNGKTYDARPTVSVRDDATTSTTGVLGTTNSPTGSTTDQYTIKINNVQIKEVASVSLIPEIPTSTSANFTYNIGIEKRDIQIAPEKANATADKLNKTIQQWEDKNAKLGKLVESWKGACLATSAVLQIKTLLNGFSGESTARSQVMNVYRDVCKANATTRSQNPSECYASMSSAIDSDVTVYTAAIQFINTQVTGKSVEQWKTDMNNASIDYTNTNYPNVQLNTGDLNSWEDIKAYLLNEQIKNSQASAQLKARVLADRNIRLVVIAQYKFNLQRNAEVTSTLAARGVTNADVFAIDTGDVKSGRWGGKTLKDIGGKDKLSHPGSFTDATPVQIAALSGKDYLLILRASSGDSLGIEQVLFYNDTTQKYDPVVSSSGVIPLGQVSPISSAAYSQITSYHFIRTSQGVCSNKYDQSNLEVEYYDSGTAKGMPAKVPFDVVHGWYVKVSGSSGGVLSDSQKGYSSSGTVSYYTICNVGEDGVENSIDVCQGFDINTDAKADSFCGLSSTELQKLLASAKDAIRQAQTQYGKSQVVINGIRMKGTTAGTSDNGLECENFMSPEDCNIMYNVCDPVICPASRCDFGGKYKVADVIQSGIFGSLFLCLPNFGSPSDGKVIVPICLTGVYAGIDGWISILKAEQKCMLDAAKTGTYTGICDEMTAVYKCEFFWRQAQPLMDNLIPKLAEGLYSGFSSTKKGGGEYLTFQTAWDNMQKSIDYFKNTYASTSFTAFKFGSVAEMGSAFCKGFVGTSLPTTAKALDSLIKPESPTQFYAQFSETSLTDATVPATSQYKVYYHIYSGKDQGVSYQVYLKNPPSSSYYSTAQQIIVDTGYVSPDDNVDNAKDFSAPAGYKELCVVINGQDNCGFKSVTSDFGLSTLHDNYALQQATANATSETTCVSGTASLLGLANLNVQAGAEEAMQPSVDLRGVVRVCASQSPGTGVELNRWINVGTCGNGMTCWLDNNSLNSNTLAVLQNSVNLASAQNALDNGVRMLNADESSQILSEQGTKITALTFDDSEKSSQNLIETKIASILSNLTNVENNGATDQYKAQAMYLKFQLYNQVVTLLTNGVTATTTAPTAPVVATTTTTPTAPTLSTGDEVVMLAKMMQGEEGNQGAEAMRAVGSVAQNRVLYARVNNDASAFGGSTLSDIISAPNQFIGYKSTNDYSSAQSIAQEVQVSTLKKYDGYYYFGNGADVNRKMIACILKNSNFNWTQVPGTTLYLSNGDYTSTSCKIPTNAVAVGSNYYASLASGSSTQSCPAPAVVETQLTQADATSTSYLATVDSQTSLISQAQASGCYWVSPDVLMANTIIGSGCTDAEKLSIVDQVAQLQSLGKTITDGASVISSNLDKTISSCGVDTPVSSNAIPTGVATLSTSTISSKEAQLNLHISWDKEFIQKKISEDNAILQGYNIIKNDASSVQQMAASAAALSAKVSSLTGSSTNSQVVVVDSVKSDSSLSANSKVISVTEDLKLLNDLLGKYNSLSSDLSSKTTDYTSYHALLKDKYGTDAIWW